MTVRHQSELSLEMTSCSRTAALHLPPAPCDDVDDYRHKHNVNDNK